MKISNTCKNPCPSETGRGSASAPPGPCTHVVPFAIDLLRRDGCVGVGARHVDVVGLDNLGHLVVNAQDGQALLVGIREGGLELLVGCGQSLDGGGGGQKHSHWEGPAPPVGEMSKGRRVVPRGGEWMAPHQLGDPELPTTQDAHG